MGTMSATAPPAQSWHNNLLSQLNQPQTMFSAVGRHPVQTNDSELLPHESWSQGKDNRPRSRGHEKFEFENRLQRSHSDEQGQLSANGSKLHAFPPVGAPSQLDQFRLSTVAPTALASGTASSHFPPSDFLHPPSFLGNYTRHQQSSTSPFPSPFPTEVPATLAAPPTANPAADQRPSPAFALSLSSLPTSVTDAALAAAAALTGEATEANQGRDTAHSNATAEEVLLPNPLPPPPPPTAHLYVSTHFAFQVKALRQALCDAVFLCSQADTDRQRLYREV
jgi:hypothetical protein